MEDQEMVDYFARALLDPSSPRPSIETPLHGFLPVYHAGGGPRWQKYSRFFSHLSAPAPGRGSSGVHESGFGRFNTETLGLSPNTIPTLQVVDDTFTKIGRAHV